MDRKVKERAKTKVKADKYYSKYKQTGESKYRTRAKKEYAKLDGIDIQLAHPQRKVTNFNANINSNNTTHKNLLSGNRVNVRTRTTKKHKS